MSLLTQIVQINFFKNKEFNQFYLSIFIMSFGEALINIFVPIYLFNLGFQVYQILIFYFLVSSYFLLFSYYGASVVARVGEKRSILLSTLFVVLYYLGLIYIGSNRIFFLLLPALLSIRMILFNYGYHLNFINHSEKKRRGRELATIGSITLLATAFAPYLGSIIATINFQLVFIISSILIVGGTVPLFFSKDKFEKINFTFDGIYRNIFSKDNRGNFISFSGYAVESVIGRTIWPIFLIVIIGSISKTGLVISISMLLSLVLFQFVGKITDKINKVRLLKIGTMLYFFSWVGRIFANSTYKVLFIDSYKNLSEKVLHLPWSAHSYDLAKREGYFEFIVSREITFNLIRVIIFPVLIFIFWADFYPFIISFIIASFASLGYIFIDK